MATVKINSGNPKYDDRPHTWPKDQWELLLSQKKQFLEVHIPYDCRCILEFIEDAEVMWQPLGYSSKDELIERGLDLDPFDVQMAVDWLKIKDPSYEIPFQVAVEEGRKLGSHGDRKSEKAIDQAYNISLKKIHGTSKEYLKGRIARDNPELLDLIESGELSVQQAAIQSGIIKVKSPYETVVALMKKLSDDEIVKLTAELTSKAGNISSIRKRDASE